MAGLDYNISHAGDWVVLAAGQGRIGVDVMKTTDNRIDRLSEFFRLMTKQFTDKEWQTIRKSGKDEQQLQTFFRHWTLKESYVKAIGTGLNLDLKTLEFHLQSEELVEGKVEEGTGLWLDGKKTDLWKFYETKLDCEHFVSVAMEGIEEKPEPFIILTVQQVFSMFDSQPNYGLLRTLDPEDFSKFQRKTSIKPF